MICSRSLSIKYDIYFHYTILKKQTKKQVKRKIDSSSNEHETPAKSTAGACFKLICENEHFQLWSKVIELNYRIDLGCTVKYDVPGVNSRNKSVAILKSLIQISMPNLQQIDNNCNDLFFALMLFNTNRKIMIQRNHGELWVEKEFPLLRDLVSETSQGKDLMMFHKQATGTSMDHVSFDHLDESESDDDPNSAEHQVRPSSRPIIDDEDSGDDDLDKVSFNELDLNTFAPKSRKRQSGIKREKTDKKKEQLKPKNITVYLDSRVKAMEDFTSKIDSVIGGKLTEIVMQRGTY